MTTIGQSKGRRTLAILCPVYNEEQTIPLFFYRILPVLEQIRDSYAAEVYFIDNGCSDGSLDVIHKLHQEWGNVYAIVLSRNFGYQCALETGLRIAEADLYVMIDVDCEDPPEMLAEFLPHHEAGYDIVYGERLDRMENAIIKELRRLFYKLTRAVADDNFVLDMAEFCLITAEVRSAILQESNSFPFLRASIGRAGFRRKNVPYKRQKRIAGETHYNLVGMTLFAVAGILSASTLALRIPAYLFPFWLLLLSAVAIHAIVAPGAQDIPLLLWLGFTFASYCLTAIGLYTARIYKNGMNRPNAIVRRGLSILPVETSQ
jgi:polyisoprenyl-phosphate glycosyltransferase